MFDVKKLVEGILAFVNFFVVRIAVSCVVVLLVYSISGQYYFDLASAYIKASPLREQDLKSYIARASEYVTESNVQNALFVVALVVCLSLLDILYRSVGKLGSLLPVMMLYNYRDITNSYKGVILQAWRRYGNNIIHGFLSS